MKRVSANRSVRLRDRVRHARLLRVLACVLALSLAWGGYAAAAMPLQARVASAGAAAAGAGEDCGHHAAPAKKTAQSPRDGCPASCACALGHATGAWPATACVTLSVATTPPMPRADEVRAARTEPPLRPPIG